MNHYTSRLCSSGLDPKAKSRYREANFIEYVDKSWPSSHAVWLKVSMSIYPIDIHLGNSFRIAKIMREFRARDTAVFYES